MHNKQEETEIENKVNNMPYKYCLNCGTELSGRYCHSCGQQAINPNPTVRGFIMEYLYNAFMWDPKFFQTIYTLIRRPGHLTNEYLSGRVISYEHPLKLNMFTLFIFITLFVLFAGTEKINNSVHQITSDERVFVGVQLELLMKNHEYVEEIKTSPRDTVLLHAPLFLADQHPSIITHLETLEQSEDKWTAILPHALIEDNVIKLDSDGYYRFNTEDKATTKGIELLISVWTQMTRLATKYFPMIILLTTPFLSISLHLVQRKNRRPRIHHFIFSLHYTAFLELLFIFIYCIYLMAKPSMAILQLFLIIASCTYLTIAFRRVYNICSWFRAISKSLFTNIIYLFINLFIFIGIFFIACFIVACQ